MAETFPFLRTLSDEFGFEALSAECDAFKESHRSVCEDPEPFQSSRQEIRIVEVEERQLSLEHSIGIAQNEIVMLAEKNTFL
jgi:hypothetical protein